MEPLGVDEPTVVGPYRLLGRLGSGGMGRVYLGRSAGGRTVAVKIVHPHFALDEEFRARFRREVEAARRVGGAWTAPVLDADPEASVPWVATGYAAGPSLAAAVADAGGPLPAHSVRVLGAGLAEALTAVHALGLVHRDVKPSNVLLTLDGPLLIDFGIARATDGTASLTSTGVSVGSPGYMSPEQILGKGVTGAADVFSLGAVLVYAATGESPFPGDSSAALLYKVVHEEPRLGSLDGELRELVAACLAKDPAGRPTPGEVARRLAPEGAARLVTAGWLPGPLVEQVSRSAVQLLNLEAAEVTPSGPVGFSSPSVGTDSGAGTPPPGGVFGPPPTMPPYAMPTYVPGQRDVQDAVAAPTVHPSTPAADPGRQGRREHREDHPGKLSVSMAATSAPGANGRGRRVSCTLALAVAGALAAVTVGSVFMFRLLPGGGDDNSASSGSDSAASPPAATPSAAGSAGATLASVPAHYLGTWSGDAYALNGKLPAGTFRVTLHQAAVGKELGTFRSTDLIGGNCDDVLVLKKVTDTQLTATSIAKTSNPGTCTTGSHEVRLTPAGGDLKYETDNADAGDPVARMARAE
ncbi:serine/threonine-protein kinase [Streptomyces sp. WAC00263]|uniref:serine/threonine-protein kinase n=1 Tax=Streptomyces sp. WAC00263 TaxID=1917422 RepID=UPI0015EF4283|nr:serine/threonine-protein kinase [Streptomyces sp. WAC00263]KAF5995573.1 serine/threonine protein kinase [Streptomyces sp. WAC00263]